VTRPCCRVQPWASC